MSTGIAVVWCKGDAIDPPETLPGFGESSSLVMFGHLRVPRPGPMSLDHPVLRATRGRLPSDYEARTTAHLS